MKKTAKEFLVENSIIKKSNVSSGLPKFDEALQWRQSSIHLIGATSYVGKTALACQIARETAKKSTGLIYFFFFRDDGDRYSKTNRFR
jgi:replicative DNA helicase